MIKKIETNKRHLTDRGWLKAYPLFSFGDYFDPNNTQFGTLRVFNDDTINPGGSFPFHDHENYEIITIMLAGELTHTDSLGNSTVIKTGEIQYMSAGTGITHAEENRGDMAVHSYQIWLIPNEQNLKPEYVQKDFSMISDKNTLLPLVSGEEREGAIVMRADATIYTSTLEASQTISYSIPKERGVFIYLRGGIVNINGLEFAAFDQARISDEKKITITAQKEAKFTLIDVAIDISKSD